MTLKEREFLARLDIKIRRDLYRRGVRVQNQAKRFISGAEAHPKRVQTGNLRSSVHTRETRYRGSPAVHVGSNVKYALYVHQGTGLFGPKRALIRPRNAKVLAFKPRRSRRTVFVRYVRGMRANHFLTDALPAARG